MSVLYTERQPPYLIYNEINHTKHIYMRDVTSVDPVWLEVMAPHFYEKRRVHSVQSRPIDRVIF